MEESYWGIPYVVWELAIQKRTTSTEEKRREVTEKLRAIKEFIEERLDGDGKINTKE
ncbi:hypothetical protein J7L09_01465 [bacterium]|nr:hypothetical protein [bacterium]